MDILSIFNIVKGVADLATSVTKTFKFDKSSAKRIGIVQLNEVIYSGDSGTLGEYRASDRPNDPRSHTINVADIPEGASILTAWYTPIHNVPAINAFAYINVEKENDKQVKLSLASFPGIEGRLRILIHVLYSQ